MPWCNIYRICGAVPALTGNQVSRDAYVAATLEALVKEPDLLETSDLHCVTLFRLFFNDLEFYFGQ
jgi:hypothetical protein